MPSDNRTQAELAAAAGAQTAAGLISVQPGDWLQSLSSAERKEVAVSRGGSQLTQEREMTQWELIAAGLLNVVAASRFALAGDFGMAVVFGAYAVACAGFVWKGIA